MARRSTGGKEEYIRDSKRGRKYKQDAEARVLQFKVHLMLSSAP